MALATSQGLAGRANERLGPLLGTAPASKLEAQVRREAAHHLAYLAVLARAGHALEEAGVAWVVLKGPVLAELCYGPAARGYTDLDLLVPARQFGPAVRALEAAGASLAQRNWPLLVKDARGQLTLRLAGQSIDLHWHFLYKRETCQRFLVPSEEVLERRRRVRLGFVDAWALEPTDFAAHVALHACLSGAHHLRWLVDIERTLTNQPPDWDVFVPRCRAWRVGLPVSVALNRARRTVGAPVPGDVVKELTGSNLGRLLVGPLSHWSPSGHMPGGRSARTGSTRALSDDLVATATDFAQKRPKRSAGWFAPARPGPLIPATSLTTSAGLAASHATSS